MQALCLLHQGTSVSLGKHHDFWKPCAGGETPAASLPLLITTAASLLLYRLGMDLLEADRLPFVGLTWHSGRPD